MLDGIEFLKKIQSLKISPFYFFVGDEDYLMDVAVEKIVDRLGAEKRVVFGDETTPSAILQEGAKLDLFGDAKPVVEVIKQVYRLKNWKAGFRNSVGHHGVVIFVSDSVSELSKRWFKSNYPLRISAIERSLKKHMPSDTVYVHFPILDKSSPLFRQWLSRELEARKLRVNAPLWQEFVEALPSKMRPILNELDRMALYFGEEGGQITRSLIADFLKPTAEAEGLAISNMLVEGDARGVVETIDALIRDGVYPGQIMATTASSFVKMLQLKNGAQRVRLPSHLIRKYRQFVTQKRYYELLELFEKFMEADMALKTFPQDDSTLLKSMFLEILMEFSTNRGKRRKNR